MGLTPYRAQIALVIFEFGKEADLIMLGVSDYREIPFQFGVNLVALTMQKGQVVYREGVVACGVGS